MKFFIDAKGLRTEVEVTHYSAPCPMRVTGTGFGDADEGESEEFEYILRDTDGNVCESRDCSAVYNRALIMYKNMRGIR